MCLLIRCKTLQIQHFINMLIVYVVKVRPEGVEVFCRFHDLVLYSSDLDSYHPINESGNTATHDNMQQTGPTVYIYIYTM